MSLAEFTDTYLAHVIAIVALGQVWAIAGYKKWIQRGTIEFYPTAKLEIGFSTFGATLSLPGAFKAKGKDVFVSQMTSIAIRTADGARHAFTWRAFKSSSLSTDTLAPQNVEIASPFTASTSVPRSTNTFFGSEDFEARYGQEAAQIRAEWSSFCQRKGREDNQFQTHVQDPVFVNNLFAEFAGGGVPLRLFSRLNNEFFWQAGHYTVELSITCADGRDRVYAWTFDLSEEDEANLRANAIPILREVCGVASQYNFVYKPYVAEHRN